MFLDAAQDMALAPLLLQCCAYAGSSVWVVVMTIFSVLLVPGQSSIVSLPTWARVGGGVGVPERTAILMPPWQLQASSRTDGRLALGGSRVW